MSCDLFSKQLEHYARGELTPAMERLLEAHLAECQACSDRLTAERGFLDALCSQAVPAPSVDFESRVLAAAARGAAATPAWRYPVAGGAIAAALALGLFIGMQWQPEQMGSDRLADADSAGGAPVAVDAVDAPPAFEPRDQTVRLAFHSGRAMEDVTLTLELPPNVELSSFPGRHHLSWRVSLKEGDNVLALPLKVLFPGDSTLVAHLDDGTSQKTFRAPIDDGKEPAS